MILWWNINHARTPARPHLNTIAKYIFECMCLSHFDLDEMRYDIMLQLHRESILIKYTNHRPCTISEIDILTLAWKMVSHSVVAVHLLICYQKNNTFFSFKLMEVWWKFCGADPKDEYKINKVQCEAESIILRQQCVQLASVIRALFSKQYETWISFYFFFQIEHIKRAKLHFQTTWIGNCVSLYITHHSTRLPSGILDGPCCFSKKRTHPPPNLLSFQISN